MKKLSKLFLSVFLSIAVAVTMVPSIAFAAGEGETDDWWIAEEAQSIICVKGNYNVQDKILDTSKYINCKDYETYQSLQYEWYVYEDEEAFDNDQATQLEGQVNDLLEAVMRGKNTYYRCDIHNDSKKESIYFCLKAPEWTLSPDPEEIEYTDKDITWVNGKYHRLTANAGGEAVEGEDVSGLGLAYEWYCIDSNGNYGSPIAGATESSYDAKVVSDIKGYACKATDRLGISHTCEFVFTYIIEWRTISEGERIEIDTNDNYRGYFVFTPNEDGYYNFYSSLYNEVSTETYGEVRDEEGNWIAGSNASMFTNGFNAVFYAEKNKKYLLTSYCINGNIGDYAVHMGKNEIQGIEFEPTGQHYCERECTSQSQDRWGYLQFHSGDKIIIKGVDSSETFECIEETLDFGSSSIKVKSFISQEDGEMINANYYLGCKDEDVLLEENELGSEKTINATLTVDEFQTQVELNIKFTYKHKELTEHPAAEATCKVDGNIAYWQCPSCQRYYSDADALNEIKEGEWITKAEHSWDNGKITTEPTCTGEGEKTLTCTVCGDTSTEAVPALGHKLVKIDRVEPTYEAEGTEEYWKCERDGCGKMFSDKDGTVEITEAKKIDKLQPKEPDDDPSGKDDEDSAIEVTPIVKLAKTKYVYSGKTIKPAVTVKVNGEVLAADAYDVDYPAAKAVGKYNVMVTLKGKYEGSAAKTFKIVPKKPVIAKATAGKKKMTVKMKTKVAKTGGKTYQIAYKIKGAKKWKYTTTTKQSKVIKKLKKGKKYQIKVRAFKKVNKVKYYSAWSKIKTTKKIK